MGDSRHVFVGIPSAAVRERASAPARSRNRASAAESCVAVCTSCLAISIAAVDALKAFAQGHGDKSFRM